MLKTLVLLLGCLMLLTGCKTIVLHPMTEKDIKMDGNWVCFSPDYVEQIMKVRVEK